MHIRWICDSMDGAGQPPSWTYPYSATLQGRPSFYLVFPLPAGLSCSNGTCVQWQHHAGCHCSLWADGFLCVLRPVMASEMPVTSLDKCELENCGSPAFFLFKWSWMMVAGYHMSELVNERVVMGLSNIDHTVPFYPLHVFVSFI